MVTSCCPSWSDMVKKLFPEFKQNISVAMTPMVLTARFVKKQHPGCKVVFVDPCDAKKLEASRKTVRSDVDFVLTFEEVPGMCATKGIDKECIPMSEAEPLKQSGKDARMFAVSGGVAQAVVNAIKSMDPEREVKVAKAAGLDECRKLLLMAKAGKHDGYLLEGMACPGGCVAGAGTLCDIGKARAFRTLPARPIIPAHTAPNTRTIFRSSRRSNKKKRGADASHFLIYHLGDPDCG